MKKGLRALSLLLILVVLLGALPARASEAMWSNAYYRAVDSTGQLSEDELDSLDQDCISFLTQYHLDMVLLAVTSKDYAGSDLQTAAEEYYEDSDFGYGDTRDGLLFLYNTETRGAYYFCFGDAADRVPSSQLRWAEEKAPELEADHGLFGVLYGGLRYIGKYLEEQSAASAEPGTEPEGTTSGMPDWYPADPQNFTFFHDEDAPRVVDAADIFTDEEEARLEERIGQIRREIQRDIVVYTDMSDYGLGRHICAADFYDFNGYGYGADREGVCLFICMDPSNRGWWCCCTGPVTRGLYTEEIANQIDDVLYEYMAAGNYAAGVANWVENLYSLYAKGNPFAPEWYPEPGQTLTSFHDPSAPRVVDEADLLSPADELILTAHAQQLTLKYGVDVAIHTAPAPYGMDRDEVGRLYYVHMGYGHGENYDGIILNLFKREGYLATAHVSAFGSVADKLTPVNEDRLEDACEDQTDEKQYFKALDQWLEQVDHMERTGRVPRSRGYWTAIGMLALAAGLIFGGISLGIARGRMATPTVKRDADAYLDYNASNITNAGSLFLYTTTSRRYDPPVETRSSGGSSGGGGGSSYSSSYSGSSGASHSGSGRSF